MKFRQYLIPDWARWVAQDEDGSWWAFEVEPHLASRSWYENEIGRSEKIGTEHLENNWKESLQRL